jgi:hypothetical protein
MLVFLGPVALGPFRIAGEEVVRMTAGADSVFPDESIAASGDGDFGRAAADAPFWFAVKKGDAVRDTIGGVFVLEGGLLGRFMVGLSQDEKKSSFGSPAGIAVTSEFETTESSVTTTSSG